MSRASMTAKMAYLVAEATNSDQSSFNPDAAVMPRTVHIPPPTSTSRLLDLGEGRLQNRRSVRDIDNGAVTIERVSQIASAAYGYLSNGHRTVPSAGGYYSLTIHVCKIDGGIIRTVYLFNPDTHSISHIHQISVPLKDGFFVYHVAFERATWMLLWSCRLVAPASKYGAKAYRFICFEIGHSAQMAIMECLEQSLQSIPLGGLNEKWLRTHVLGENRRLWPHYVLIV